jgi:hypothetical protein
MTGEGQGVRRLMWPNSTPTRIAPSRHPTAPLDPQLMRVRTLPRVSGESTGGVDVAAPCWGVGWWHAGTHGDGNRKQEFAARKEGTAMILRYLRYTLASLATVAFGLTLN